MIKVVTIPVRGIMTEFLPISPEIPYRGRVKKKPEVISSFLQESNLLLYLFEKPNVRYAKKHISYSKNRICKTRKSEIQCCDREFTGIEG